MMSETTNGVTLVLWTNLTLDVKGAADRQHADAPDPGPDHVVSPLAVSALALRPDNRRVTRSHEPALSPLVPGEPP